LVGKLKKPDWCRALITLFKARSLNQQHFLCLLKTIRLDLVAWRQRKLVSSWYPVYRIKICQNIHILALFDFVLLKQKSRRFSTGNWCGGGSRSIGFPRNPVQRENRQHLISKPLLWFFGQVGRSRVFNSFSIFFCVSLFR